MRSIPATSLVACQPEARKRLTSLSDTTRLIAFVNRDRIVVSKGGQVGELAVAGHRDHPICFGALLALPFTKADCIKRSNSLLGTSRWSPRCRPPIYIQLVSLLLRAIASRDAFSTLGSSVPVNGQTKKDKTASVDLVTMFFARCRSKSWKALRVCPSVNQCSFSAA